MVQMREYFRVSGGALTRVLIARCCYACGIYLTFTPAKVAANAAVMVGRGDCRR